MEFKELEVMAYSNEPMPGNLSLPQQHCYLSFRHLYSAYRRGELDVEQAKREKRAIQDSYQQAMQAYQEWVHGYVAQQERVKQSDLMLTQLIQQAGELEERALLLLAVRCISQLRGELVSYETFKKRLEAGIHEKSAVK